MYLDHAASSGAVAIEAQARMRELLRLPLGNPSSAHSEGRLARKVLRQSREEAAAAIGAKPEEIVFTSGVTEALQLAVLGLIPPVGTLPVVTSRYDHKATLNALRATGRQLVQVDGALPPASLYVLMAVSNELGWRFDIPTTISAPLIVDCAQGTLYAPELWRNQSVTAMALPSHKIGGPTGIGMLVLRQGVPFVSTLRGGPQEHELRAGTEAVIAIAGFARRLSTLLGRRHEVLAQLQAASDAFVARLTGSLRGVRVVSAERPSAPGILALQILGVSAKQLVDALDAQGVALSAKSACGAHTDASAVVLGAGFSRERALETFRVSFHYHTEVADAVQAADVIAAVARTLRGEVAA